jgi:CheY-like chemotaxis protein
VPSSLGSLSFLVLDDNANMAQIVKIVLKSFGATNVYEAKTVGEAFGLCRAHGVDIAFVDYVLPGLDGIAFTRLIRTASDSPNPYLPIIMLSAHTEQHRVKAARDAGATEFCAKPITALEIHRKIMDVVSRPRPFIRSTDFFGPCRRRRNDPAYAGPERRRDAAGETEEGHAAQG